MVTSATMGDRRRRLRVGTARPPGCRAPREAGLGSADGQHLSSWVGAAPESDDPTHTADGRVVAVAGVGGGLTGRVSARRLADAGASVALVEAGRVGAGVTGCSTAKVTLLHGLAYASLEKTFGEPGAR